MHLSSLAFTKMTGAGNDFLLVDLIVPGARADFEKLLGDVSVEELARRVCHRYFGLGADGLVLLVPSTIDSTDQFAWEFYNSDGSHAEMCGNAARCAARFAARQGHAGERMSFTTRAGSVGARLMGGDQVAVEMPAITRQKWACESHVGETRVAYDWLDTGVPHAVVHRDPDHATEASVKAWIAGLRSHADLGAPGANVTLVRQTGPAAVATVTFERGVEDFTLACGTGAVAAAFWLHHRQPQARTVDVRVPGGKLSVDFSGPRPILTGPAVFLGEIRPFLEALVPIS